MFIDQVFNELKLVARQIAKSLCAHDYADFCLSAKGNAHSTAIGDLGLTGGKVIKETVQGYGNGDFYHRGFRHGGIVPVMSEKNPHNLKLSKGKKFSTDAVDNSVDRRSE